MVLRLAAALVACVAAGSRAQCSAQAPCGGGGKIIAVTGATGFACGHIVQHLLEATPHTVHATARNVEARPERVQFLRDLAAASPERLALFSADLASEASFDAPFTGADVVIACAAVTEVRFPPGRAFEEIISPGIDGMRNIARAARRAGVRRIVLTASGSLVDQFDPDREPHMRGQPFHEDEVKMDLRPERLPYVAEKILSERALAGEFLQGAAHNRSVISLLPTLIIGPQQNAEVRSSQTLMKVLANREAPLAPRFYASWIDVRDCAKAHRLAIDVQLPPGVHFRRFFVSNPEVIDAAEIAERMNRLFPGLNAPTTPVPHWLNWIASFFDDRLTDYLRLDLSVPRAEAGTSRDAELGFVKDYRDLDRTIEDTVRSFAKFGIIGLPA